MGWVGESFCWQTGYAAFSVSREIAPKVFNYIMRQKEKHANLTYRDELVRMLNRVGVTFDERYLIDGISDDMG